MKWKIVLSATSAALLAGGGTAVASTITAGPVDSSGVIHGCWSTAAIKGTHVIVLQDSGVTCPKGMTAISWNQTGPRGPKGDSGAAGPAGAVGPTGPAGPIGPIGAKGDTGAAGPAGNVGPAGLIGPIGPIGPQGLKGDTGSTGAAGGVGPAGPAGPVGPAGPKGDTGATGPTGGVGPAGPAGPPGPQGPQGPAGAAGDQFGTGTQTSTAALPPTGCYLGEVMLWAGILAPGTPANGQILPISQNQALFSLLGTKYGGNGTSNFALPNLNKAAPNGMTYTICTVGVFPSAPN